MGFGILADKHLSHVPGTVLLVDREKLPTISGDPSRLKHDPKNPDVVLVPQPSDDPNDTLNWTRRRKFWVMICIVYGSALVGAIGPLISPGLLVISEDLGITLTEGAQFSGALVQAIAIGTFFSAAGGTIYGGRPMYTIAGILLFVTSIWCAVGKTYPSILAARVIAGFGMAPLETLVPATLSDIFFVHERATALAVWSTALGLGISVTPFVNGVVIDKIGWRWCFWLIAMQFAIMVVIFYLFVPETRYIRASVHNLDTGSKEKINELVGDGADSPQSPSVDVAKDESGDIVHLEHGRADIPSLKTFKQNLAIYTGRKSPKGFWRVFFRPFSVMFSPVVLWAALIYGTTSALFVVLSVLQSQIWASPPYFFNAEQVGYTGAGGLALFWVGLLEGPLLDWIVKKMAQRNHGVFEPEFRLVFIIPQLILQVMGLVGWGISAKRGDHWIVPVIFSTLFSLGQGFGSLASTSYVIDAHRERAAEVFTVITLYKNTLTFAFTWFVNSWLQKQGMMAVLGTLGGLIAACSLTTIPMYIYGKRARSWVHRMGLDKE
ncbi:putative cycloheximide resistance protein [Leucosporidium creatinivorum]|uniref:Putative cycloheximide resistance protein n=1 Tax=Leucosporidium creatinivorum TaxID=106004 RepID=A0A1Y2D2C6_9BASI|nr:putative cycloheximide resistance protein [Leucosporidium creatinivorum]